MHRVVNLPAALMLLCAAASPCGAQDGAAVLGPRASQRIAAPLRNTPEGARGDHALVLSRSAVVRGDSTRRHYGTREHHIAYGVGIGIIGGFLIGRSIDGGRAGCNNEQSGLRCDWLSGYEEPGLAIIGGLLGAGIGALLPHD